MRKNNIFILIFILAVLGGIVRGFELVNVFDTETGLAAPWHPLSVALYTVTLISAVLIVFPASGGFTSEIKSYTEAFAACNKYIIAVVISALLLVISAGIDVFDFISMSDAGNPPPVSRLILALLSIFCAGAVIYLAKTAQSGNTPDSLGIWALIPVVYGCFLLILTFSDRAADPVILDYVYELFAAVAITLGFYYSAGFASGNAKVRRTLIAMLFAFYFSAVSCIGPFLGAFSPNITPDTHSISKLFTFTGMTVYFLASATAFNNNQRGLLNDPKKDLT